MEDWAEIRRLARAEGMPIKAIARRLGVARNTVRSALKASEPPRYSRPGRGSLVDAVEPRVREQLRLDAKMPATVIAQRIGWTRSLTILKDRIRQIRPEYLGVDPADRIEYSAGDTAQCDLWFPNVPIGMTSRKLPVLVMTAAYSKFFGARLLPSRLGGDLTAGMWEILRDDFQAVPKRLWWDRESAIAKTGRPTELAGAFAGSLATRFVIAPPRDPEFKGMVERRNRYLETSFLPGRSFTSPLDFSAQLSAWMREIGNQRKPRTLGGSTPAAVMSTDRAAMTKLPPVEPVVGLRHRVRLARDYYVRLDTNDYSVDPRFIGRFVDVASDLLTVTVRCEGQEVSFHDRSWGLRATITNPHHRATARDLRHAFAADRDLAARQQTAQAAGEQVPRRSLTDYDKYYGKVTDATLPTDPDSPDGPGRPRLEVVR